MTTVKALLAELAQEAGVTRRVLERIPEDRLRWRPHERSMTLGQLALHAASLPGAIAELSLQKAFDVRTEVPRPEVASREAVLGALERSLGRAKTLLGAMNDADLALPWRMVNGEHVVMELSRGAFLRSVMLNHLYHHRGQLTVYLRLVGAPVPAVYGDSADETLLFAEASAHPIKNVKGHP